MTWERFVFFWLGLSTVFATPSTTAATQERLRLLWIGNSYTNDTYSYLLHLLRAHGSNTELDVVCPSGRTWAQHANSLSDTNDRFSLDPFLGDAQTKTYDYVILQEQSHTAGLWPIACNASVPETQAYCNSTTALLTLVNAINQVKATPILFNTWEKAGNGINRDWATRNDILLEGYLRYQRELVNSIAPASLLAPVGIAWSIVFHDTRGGENPPVTFDQLVMPDGRHPSVYGGYLAALVIAGTINKAPLTGQKYWYSHSHRDFSEADKWDYLMEVARRALRSCIPVGFSCSHGWQCGGPCHGECSMGKEGICVVKKESAGVQVHHPAAAAGPEPTCKRIPWFMGLMSANQDADYYSYLKVALLSAKYKAPSLVPYLIFDGAPNEVTAWFEREGGRVIFHHLSIRQAMQTAVDAGVHPPEWLQGSGAFLRIEIPLIYDQVEANHAHDSDVDTSCFLYTDSDVLILRDINSCSFDPPRYFTIGSEHNRGSGPENTGVMFANATAFAEMRPDIVAHGIAHNWDFQSMDQGLITDYIRVRNLSIPTLPDKFNWKGYWGGKEEDEVTILHFHGPKPQRCLPCLLQHMESAKEMCGDGICAPVYHALFAITPDQGLFYKKMLQVYNVLKWETLRNTRRRLRRVAHLHRALQD